MEGLNLNFLCVSTFPSYMYANGDFETSSSTWVFLKMKIQKSKKNLFKNLKNQLHLKIDNFYVCKVSRLEFFFFHGKINTK